MAGSDTDGRDPSGKPSIAAAMAMLGLASGLALTSVAQAQGTAWGRRRRGGLGAAAGHGFPRPACGERATRHGGKPELGSVRGRFHTLRLAAAPPHPDLLHSPSKTGVNALMARGEKE
jgi:hypothetical protein